MRPWDFRHSLWQKMLLTAGSQFGESLSQNFRTANLRNRIAFRAADIDGAKETANFIGQRTVAKRSWGHTQGRFASSYRRTEEFKIKPHQLMELSDRQAVVVHCSKRWQKMKIPAKNPDGSTGFKQPSMPAGRSVAAHT